jgi:hypothetical protein
MGWGDTTLDDETKVVSNVLMAVDVQVISNDECSTVQGTDGVYTNNYANYIFPSMICSTSFENVELRDVSGFFVMLMLTDVEFCRLPVNHFIHSINSGK